MVPSEWRRGVMVPFPKKKSRGTDACTPDDFRGISVHGVCRLQSHVQDCTGAFGEVCREETAPG